MACTPAHIRDIIVEQANLLGFDDVGIARAEMLPTHAAYMEEWLGKGYQGTMSYLERNREKRYDPRLLHEGTISVVTVLQNYYPAEQPENQDNFKIAKYALGKDYHQVIRDKLRLMLKAIEAQTGPLKARAFTDSAPVLDRAWAEKCGLGFIGKNTCLIHPRKGSFFFIGHLFLPLEVEEKTETITDYCGTCRRCIDACPTGALVAPHQLDANKCISYLTIEYRGELPGNLREKFSGYIFGCDICQDVCPWNRFAKPHREPLFTLRDELRQMRRDDWLKLDEQKFDELFKDSAVQRTGYEGLKRNISFVSGENFNPLHETQQKHQ
ncbi:MAG: tRNA epoxyqueuosine(34) reductase QueG [Bacteroidetes bacterium]|nr:tRNA epoxyqueuosine(34) reductase QueG [Bacteroidota bacterium]